MIEWGVASFRVLVGLPLAWGAKAHAGTCHGSLSFLQVAACEQVQLVHCVNDPSHQHSLCYRGPSWMMDELEQFHELLVIGHTCEVLV